MGEKKEHYCEKHGSEMEYGDCSRCRGEGQTEEDYEDMMCPITWHNGRCYVCGGSGQSPFPSCYFCDEEYEAEMFNDFSETRSNL